MAKDLLEDIKEPVKEYLLSFDDMYETYTENSVELIKKLSSYIHSSKGKQIRPILTLLSAGLHGQINDGTLRAALSLELLHTATLAHDDVVDNSYLRRHKDTINAIWGNKIAILTGDYFLTVLLSILIRNNDFDTLAVVSEAARQIIEGEFLQQQKSLQFDYSEENYFDVICKKTAVLIGACCETGALSVGTGKEMRARMYEIGRLLGLAFQIKDDILDYSIDSKTGKLPGNDIKELKFTLPLIYHFQTISSEERQKLLHDLKTKNSEENFVNYLINSVISSGGLAYAEKRMNEICEEVREKISGFPSSIYKEAFMNAVDYISIRNT